MGRWPQHKAWFWEYAPFFRALVPLVAGIMSYQYGWMHHLPYYSAAIATVFFAVAYGLSAVIKPVKPPHLVSFFLLQITLTGFGYSLSTINDASNNKLWFGNNLNKNATYLARLSETPAEREQSWKLQVELVSTIDDKNISRTNGKAFVYVYKDELPMFLQKGDTVLLPGNWQAVKNAGNPYEFDYAAYCRRNNIAYQQFCQSSQVRLYATDNPKAASFPDKAHDWCTAQLDEYITDHKTKGLIQAMLLGDEVNLDEDLRQSFSDTGIVHIIAISGGNVMMFFTFISVLLWWVRHRKYLWLKYLIALPLVWFYVIMAGSSPSAIRAAIMFSIFAWGLMFQKNNNSLNQLFATAFLLLCAQPTWLYSIGFQLSFIAVLSLILFYSPIHGLLLSKNKWVKKVWATICASLAAEILVAPVVIYYFHNFPLLFLVANVAAYIFMGLVLILGIAIIALSWLPAIAKIVGIITTGLVLFFDKMISWMQALNPASFHFLLLTIPQLIFLYISIAGIAYFLLRKKKTALFTGLAAFSIFIGLLSIGKWTSLHQQQLVVYNVSKGNHIEYLTEGQYHVIGPDTLPAKKIEYATKPSHIQWQSWKKGDSLNDELFRINNQTVLILNKELGTARKFPTDYLIINYSGTINPLQLATTYSPKLIIIGNNYSRKQQEQWVKAADACHIPIHTLSRDGAFVLGN